MHYHVVLTVDGQEDFTGTFDTRAQAEEAAEAIGCQRDDWGPRRYPGRSWRPGEVAVYLDRRRVTRQELAVIRCLDDGGEPRSECHVWGPAAAELNPSLDEAAASAPSSIAHALGMTHVMTASAAHSSVR